MNAPRLIEGEATGMNDFNGQMLDGLFIRVSFEGFIQFNHGTFNFGIFD